MATSETLLTVVAIWLAALVVAGFVAKTATVDHPLRENACVPAHAVASVEMPPAAQLEADEMLRDMLLHD